MNSLYWPKWIKREWYSRTTMIAMCLAHLWEVVRITEFSPNWCHISDFGVASIPCQFLRLSSSDIKGCSANKRSYVALLLIHMWFYCNKHVINSTKHRYKSRSFDRIQKSPRWIQKHIQSKSEIYRAIQYLILT